MKCSINTNRILNQIDGTTSAISEGWVSEITGIVIKARLPHVKIGDICWIKRHSTDPLYAEIVGFRDDDVLLMPLGDARGVSTDSTVISTGRPFRVKCGNNLRGRILDALGRPMDLSSKGELEWESEVDVYNSPPDPLKRMRITQPLSLGIRAIDGLLTTGLGQRIGIFAAAGTGKSTLLGSIARSASVDVNVVALIGERGREVRDFIEESLGEEGLEKTVVIVATSDQPSLVRLKAAFVATAVAEYFRDQGLNVLLMMDSITRFARAQREVGLAIGEPPTRGGYTPSVFSVLPQLLERSGNSTRGSITALYTVLVAGDDLTEPVADEVMSILDGHIVLSRKLATRCHYPAIDILQSKSRVMNQVVTTEHVEWASKFIETYSKYEENRDSITFGFYKTGSNPQLDTAISLNPRMNEFLQQKESKQLSIESISDRIKIMMTGNNDN